MVNIFLLTVQKWTESHVQMNSFLDLKHPELQVIAGNRLWSGRSVFCLKKSEFLVQKTVGIHPMLMVSWSF